MSEVNKYILPCDNYEVEGGIVFWDFGGSFQIDTCGITEINFESVESFKKFVNELNSILREVE